MIKKYVLNDMSIDVEVDTSESTVKIAHVSDPHMLSLTFKQLLEIVSIVVGELEDKEK